MAKIQPSVEYVGMAIMSIFRSMRLISAVVALFGVSVVSFGQNAATLEGKAVDATGQPLRNAVVRLITDQASSATSRTWRYMLVVDGAGNYRQSGIAPGNYVALLFADGKGLDIVQNVVLKSGDAKFVNFDFTRKDHGRADETAQTAAVVDHRRSAVLVR
jgi:Carboxypeptidase regulatory-like domain